MKAPPQPYLLVGEAPPPGTIRTPYHRLFAARIVCAALDEEPRRRLGRELGRFQGKNAWPERMRRRLLTRFISSCEHVNLLPRWPGYAGRGSAFPLDEARRHAEQIRVFPPKKTIILAGRRVAAAFSLRSLDYFDPRRIDGAAYILVPHPSGVNKWWNDPGNRERARIFLESMGRLAPPRAGGLGLGDNGRNRR